MWLVVEEAIYYAFANIFITIHSYNAIVTKYINKGDCQQVRIEKPMQKHPPTKPGTPSFVPSKTIITSWLKSVFPDMPLSSKIEDFGDGVIYCRLLHHYYGNPQHSKITWAPKNQYQYANNLKHVQTALLQLGVVIPFDVNRVAKRKFLENWSLINSFYKHFNSVEEPTVQEDNSASSHGVQGHPMLTNPHAGMFGGYQPTPLLQAPKSLKRPQPVVPHYQQSDQSTQRPHYPHHAPQPQPQLWDHNHSLPFSSLAHNSLQMTQYLKQNINLYNSSPNKGKWSVGSQMFQNNNHAVIDRVKEILLKGSHDTEKIRQIKMLLGMPIDEEEVIKIEDDEGNGPIVYTHKEEKPKQIQKEKMEAREQKTVMIKQEKELHEIMQKETSSTNNREPKLSVSKSGRKPFKI